MSNTKPPIDPLRERYRHITDLIESGRYYKDARDWYATVYLAPYTHRFWMSILSSMAVLGGILGYLLVDSMFPLSKAVPFATYIHWKDEYYPSINKLAENIENSNEMIAVYFLKNYVKDQEEYTPPNFKGGEDAAKGRLSRIEHQSKKRVYHNYLERINPNNSNSPSQLYANRIKREVMFDDVHQQIKLPKRFKTTEADAIVPFTTVEIRGEERVTDSWNAYITFSITDANLALREKKPLRLYVSDYKVSKVRDNAATAKKR